MDRRRFLGLLGTVGVGVALGEVIPLGRVWSFPKEIRVATFADPFAIRVIKTYSPETGLYHARLDILYGFAELTPEYVGDAEFLKGEKWPTPAARPSARPLPS